MIVAYRLKSLETSSLELSVPTNTRPRAIVSVLCVAILEVSAAQQIPSKPISEYQFKAGVAFNVGGDLLRPISQAMQINVAYQLTTPKGPDSFSCMGYSVANQMTFTLSCNTDRRIAAGEYRSDGRLTFRRMETGEAFTVDAVRLPIVTIEANPFDSTEHPEVAGTYLLLTPSQSLSDGARRTQDILSEISLHFPKNMQNSKENRNYLRQEIEKEKTVIDLTRNRYLKTQGANVPPPLFFQDFDRRLDVAIRELGGVPSRVSSLRETMKPHLVLAQLPKTSDAINAKDPTENLDGRVKSAVTLLLEIKKAFEIISESGKTTFMWSATTIPPGAEIWTSRLGEPETKLVGATNFPGQAIEYSIWTFRIDWSGCSKVETLNPWKQTPIAIKLARDGCVKK